MNLYKNRSLFKDHLQVASHEVPIVKKKNGISNNCGCYDWMGKSYIHIIQGIRKIIQENGVENSKVWPKKLNKRIVQS